MANDISEKLRTKVARRADHRCEYCLISGADAGYSHQVDHIISRNHTGPSTVDNLAFACMLCNRHKGSDIASIDLRQERQFGSFTLVAINGMIISVLSAPSLSRLQAAARRPCGSYD